MGQNNSEKFNQLLEKAKTDNNVVGLFLTGSRGKGFENEYSDYDIKIIIRDDAEDVEFKDNKKFKSEDMDLTVMSLANLRKYAEWNSAFAWDRYSFARVKALMDKTDEIQKIIDEKGIILEKDRSDFITSSLDAYINQVYRSVKCLRNNNEVGARLEAAASIPSLLDLVFAIHGRVRPFFGYLEKELGSVHLEKLPWKSDEFINKILLIQSSADLSTQQEVLKTIKALLCKEGYDKVFDDWNGKDKWAMEYRPQ